MGINKLTEINYMKKFYLLCAFLFVVTIAVGQQKKFVSYTVQKGETMKSIAKDYDMSRKDLMRLNPGVPKKPRPNTVIIVPNLNYGRGGEVQQAAEDI